MGWVHPSGLGRQNAAVGIEDTGSPPHPRRLVRIPFRTALLIYDGVAATEERRDRGVGDGRVEGLLQV
jgi:hypothetical protein